MDDYITQGYRIVTRDESSVSLKKKKKASITGYLLVFIFTGWWTFGIGNLIYHLLRLTEDDILVCLQNIWL